MAAPVSGSAGSLEPTFQGFIGSTMDALVLFEACLAGVVQHVARRPHDRERSDLIKSGNIFIYEEHSSGIKRWTDGIAWSPSRILGNFLLYRELDKPFQPGEKKRANKRPKIEGGVSKSVPTPRASTSLPSFAPGAMPSPTSIPNMDPNVNDNADRAYVGSLVDSYQFKENGLIKKTISVVYKGVQHHLVSYYTLSDIKKNVLKSVTQSGLLSSIVPRHSLMQSGNFRAPIDDGELNVLDPNRLYGYPPMDYMGVPNRSMSIQPGAGFGHTQTWASTQHYAPNPAYSLPQTIPSHTTNYGQTLAQYSYDPSYGPSRPHSYSPIIQNRRHSDLVPSTNGATALAYQQSPMITHGSSLSSHDLATSSYSDMLSASAANAAAESASTSVVRAYGATGVLGQSSGAHGIGSSVPQSTTGFHSQMTNGYDNSMSRLPMNNFGDPLQEPAGQTFGSTSAHNTPTDLPIGLDHSDLPSADQEWNTTGSVVPKHEDDRW
ncbi:Gti1/Pac2 family-domain-containing protein [Xylaria sp. FL0043]|nr:Gti1/Pac2 family-domain-containing protein [Xylaria sp. FL0043]